MSTTRVTHARHRRKYNFHLYIHKVLKALDQGFKISKNAMEISDSCVEDLCHRIISQAAELVKINGRKTFTEKSMYTATRMVIGDSPLCNAAVVEGVAAVKRYDEAEEAQSTSGGKRQRKSEKAGLIFPVSRVHKKLKEADFAVPRSSRYAAVFLAAVLEYMITEVLDLSIRSAALKKKTRISPTDIRVSIKNDAALDKLFKDAIIPGSATTPHVNSAPPKKSVHHKRAKGAHAAKSPKLHHVTPKKSPGSRRSGDGSRTRVTIPSPVSGRTTGGTSVGTRRLSATPSRQTPAR